MTLHVRYRKYHLVAVTIGCGVAMYLWCVGVDRQPLISRPIQFPDLKAATWDKVCVYYCVGAPPTVEMRTWESTNALVLNKLKGSLCITSTNLLSNVYMEPFNAIEIQLVDKRKYWLFLSLDKNKAALYAPSDYIGYALCIGPEFGENIRELIEDTEETEIHFGYYPDIVRNSRVVIIGVATSICELVLSSSRITDGK